MKLKPIMRLTIAPLSLILLLSVSSDSCSMDYSRRANSYKTTPAKAPAAAPSFALTTSPIGSIDSTASATDTPLPESTVLGKAGSTAPGARSYADVAADMSKSGILKRPAAAAPVTITVPVAPIAVSATTPRSPRAMADGTIPPVRPAGPLTTVDSTDAIITGAPAAAATPAPEPAPAITQPVPAASEKLAATPKVIVDTSALPLTTRFAGVLYQVAGYPEEYKSKDADGNTRIRVSRLQRELVRRAKGAEVDIAGAVEILQEAKCHEISIGASFADAAFDSLQESSDLRSAELAAQTAHLRNKLRTSTTADIDFYMTTINTLAQQVKLRKEGRDLAAERAVKAGSRVARSQSPLSDYVPEDSATAKAKLDSAIETYIAAVTNCTSHRAKADARLAAGASGATAAATGTDDGSGGACGGSIGDKR